MRCSSLVPYLAALDLVPVLLALLHHPQHEGVNLVGQLRLQQAADTGEMFQQRAHGVWRVV